LAGAAVPIPTFWASAFIIQQIKIQVLRYVLRYIKIGLSVWVILFGI
jgi:hypothetical protein